MDLIAIRPLKYNTRHLVPGDVFSAKSPNDGKLLIAIKRAKLYRTPNSIPAPPPIVQKKIEAAVTPTEPDSEDEGDEGDEEADVDFSKIEEMRTMRSEYQEKYGKRAYTGWDRDTLQEKLDADSDE